jgi:Domain of unknown function (DUF4389)
MATPDPTRPPSVPPASVPPHALRVLHMIFFGVVFWILCWTLAVTAVLQLVLTLLATQPNAELVRFGRGLGHYCQHIVEFLTFATDAVPFPFSPWPAA